MSFWNDFKHSLKEFTVGETESGGLPIYQKFIENLKVLINTTDKETAFQVFERNFMFLKGLFFLIILIMAIHYPKVYHTEGIIKTKSKLFFAESLVFGLSVIIPFLLLLFLRKNKFSKNQIFANSIALFMVFFALNYLLELSGFYTLAFNGHADVEPIDPVDAKGRFIESISYALRIVLAIVLVLSLFMILFSTYIVRDSTINYKFKNINKWILFMIESILFGAISAVPIYFIAFNREALDPKKTSEEFLIITAKFVFLNIILQFSGFYNHIFN